jgi:hypothetical protein
MEQSTLSCNQIIVNYSTERILLFISAQDTLDTILNKVSFALNLDWGSLYIQSTNEIIMLLEEFFLTPLFIVTLNLPNHSPLRVPAYQYHYQRDH